MKQFMALIICLCSLAGCSPTPDATSEETDVAKMLAEHNYARALLAASDALERGGLSPTEAADNLLAIAECHAAAGNHYAAMEFSRRAADTAPEYLPARRALIDEATLAGNHQLALEILKTMPRGDSLERISNRRQLIAPALATGQTDLAANALRALMRDSVDISVEQTVAMARIFRDENHSDSADILIRGIKIDDITSPSAMHSLADYFADTDNRALAIDLYRRFAGLQTEAMQSAAAAGIYSNLYEYEHSNLRRLELDARNHRQRLTLIAAIFALALIVAIVLALYLRTVSRRKLLASENRLLLATEELRAHSEQSRSAIGRLFRENYDSLEFAANLFIDGSASRSTAGTMLLRQLEEKVRACRTPEFLTRLEQAVNEAHGNIIARMRADITSLSDTDLSTALFLATGLSQRALCLLLDCTPASLYNKKYRLKRRINDSGLPPETIASYLEILG